MHRILIVTCAVLTLAGCGSRETKEALNKASALESQGQYREANDLLINALNARENKIREAMGTPADSKEADALNKKIQSDLEILKMERAQIPIYLALEHADLASAVYTDIQAGNPGDTVIFDALQNKDPKIRIGAARVLALAGKGNAIAPLSRATKDPDQDVRRAAVAALGALKDPRAVPVLIDSLRDSYWFTRSEAANALGQLKDMQAVKSLLGAVADTDSTVESSAENALIALCSTANSSDAPTDEFAAHLDDPNQKIALISAACLAILKDPRAVPSLLKVAASEDPQMRLHAVKALGGINDPASIAALRQGIKDSDEQVRGWSIIGLGRLKDSTAVPDLNAIAANPKETPDIRAAAAASVKHITGETTATNAPPDGH